MILGLGWRVAFAADVPVIAPWCLSWYAVTWNIEQPQVWCTSNIFKQHQTANCRGGPEMSGDVRMVPIFRFSSILPCACQASGVTSFWAPTAVFVASRIIANLMGLVPGLCAAVLRVVLIFADHILLLYVCYVCTFYSHIKVLTSVYGSVLHLPTQYQYHTNIYKLLKSLLDESKRAWSFYFQGSSAIKSQGPCLNWRRHASWTSDNVHVFLPGGILWFLDNT